MLALSSKHALKALLALAEGARGAFVPVADLAEDAEVPSPYLSKLMKRLAQSEIVSTRKGPNGGIALPRRKISVYEVCAVLEDPIIFDTCLVSKQACAQDTPCPLHGEWSKERRRIHAYLRKLCI